MKKRIAAAAICAVAALIAWGSMRRQPAEALPPRNVLLITIDTLRADALGAYGNPRAVTPTIDRLAHGGLRFDNARAHNVVTLPSHANILTGRLPVDHGVRDNSGFRFPADDETLATWLKARGFRTGAFVSAFPLDSRFGLARGFEVYDDRFVDATARPAMLEQERRGTATVEAASRWIQSQTAGAPWFCWVHLYEPHFPYAPPAPYDTRFASDAYAGEVAAVDDALRPLLQPVLDAGASTRTLVVLTSDHGEALGDHGEATHGIFAYEATLKVPLIAYYPPRLKPRTISAPAGHVDIAPTILDALGLEPIERLRGRNLLDSGEAPHATYFEALSGSLNRGWAPLTGVVVNGMKYVDLPVAELYDLHSDPQERRNLAAERSHEVAGFRARLAEFAAGNIKRTSEDAETRRRLQSLGYAASSTPDTPGRVYTERDDPKQLIGFETKLQQVVDLYLDGKVDEAVQRARALTAEQPRMRVALMQLAHLERETGNAPAAIAALQRALTLNPSDPEVAALLGAYLTGAGRHADAIALLQTYADQPAADAQVLVTLALAQARNKRIDDALALVARARAADPSNAMLFVDAGTIHMMAGNRNEARTAFEAALAMNPEVARAHRSLAVMAMDAGDHDAALTHWRAAARLDPGEFGNLLSVALNFIRGGRAGDARPYLQFFADNAPPSRYAADIARARGWLVRGR